MPRGRCPQIQQPRIRWIVGVPGLDRLDPGFGRNPRCVEIGLAGGEIDDVLSGRPTALGILTDRHRGRRLELLNVLRKPNERGNGF